MIKTLVKTLQSALGSFLRRGNFFFFFPSPSSQMLIPVIFVNKWWSYELSHREGGRRRRRKKWNGLSRTLRSLLQHMRNRRSPSCLDICRVKWEKHTFLYTYDLKECKRTHYHFLLQANGRQEEDYDVICSVIRRNGYSSMHCTFKQLFFLINFTKWQNLTLKHVQ